jgi:hypothetical protein
MKRAEIDQYRQACEALKPDQLFPVTCEEAAFVLGQLPRQNGRGAKPRKDQTQIPF